MLGAIASGTTVVKGFASSQDCQSTLNCLSHLGISAEKRDGSLLIIGSSNGLNPPRQILDVGNSGSTMRMLSGILAGQSFESEMTGDQSIQRRPMQRIIDPLTQMGATIGSSDGRAPLRINGGNLKPITYRLPVASAQVKSCVLLAGLFATGETTVIEPIPTRDHTERMLRTFGVDLEIKTHGQDRHITINGPTRLESQEINVPGDVSSAAFFVCAALIVPDSDIVLTDVGLNPTRTGLMDLLSGVDANIEILNQKNFNDEPVGDVRIRHSKIVGREKIVVDGALVANAIDEIPILAVLATQSESGFVIRDAGELRHKESDRIATVVEGLRSMGARVTELPDGMNIEGKQRLHGARIDSHDDHRIAMAFAVAGLVAEGETEIIGAESAAVSFPEFFDTLNSLAQ
jgi:3-phosphoshikimate 1-carboxyvinyltransferase